MRKKKGIIQKIASFFLAFSMLLGVVAGTSGISEGATHPDAFTKIEAQLQDGSGPIYEIGQYQVFRLKASFALPNGAVKKDDTTTIKLPNELIFNQTSDIKIKDGAGNVIANAVFNLYNKTLKLTYTDYAESHSDIKGIFYFFVRMDRDVVDGEMHIPLIFDVDGKPWMEGVFTSPDILTTYLHIWLKPGGKMQMMITKNFIISSSLIQRISK